ncbi:sensor histidine kinase [Sediminibacterium ginsengisoli]|uniref:histidine kinase n=1 Tax=Sediminibacterium ginsengisoli TaxID=413434 RepID=A0A1T4QCP2_9BACT|nr:ATP-binding protein [Sediminibacterium ginsengisoli]SKA01465.1 PAS domain S-box-containing protein [Sediminibacterium ginsengisoli]
MSEKNNTQTDWFRQMIEEVQDYAIIRLDADGVIQNWNLGAEKIKGYPADEIVGKHFRIFYTAEDQASALPEQLMNQAVTKGKATHEGWRVRKNGNCFWGSTVITALHNEQGDVVSFSKVTRDLTERKLGEDRLKEYTQKLEFHNQELEQFTYLASHDLQEPVRKIETFAYRLLDKAGDELKPESRLYLEKIIAATGRMGSLMKAILNYSRLTYIEDSFVPTDLNKILQDVLSDFDLKIHEKQAVIEADRLPEVVGLPLYLNQLLYNLVGNALKFTRPGIPPVIRITCRLLNSGEKIRYGYPERSKCYHIAVADNGIGFSQEYAEVIFMIFQRLNAQHTYEGTGIGLALCRKIVMIHGGRIWASSTEGEGTTIHMLLCESGPEENSMMMQGWPG